jgi:microcystin degradation protein MlrC
VKLYAPIELTGEVWRITSGDFVHQGPGMRGAVMHRGQTAVLKVGRIFIVVMERAVNQWDPELYRSVGLEPARAQIVIVKSPAGFRAAYEPFAVGIEVLDAAGVCSPQLTQLPFKRIPRPLYPFDEMTDWRA